MPFINTKYSQKITPEQETELKTALGSAVSILGKTESWLMLGFEQECSLYFRGEKSEKIAFVDVSLYGPASRLLRQNDRRDMPYLHRCSGSSRG